MVRFLLDNIPTAGQILTFGPPSLALSLAYLWLAGWLKRARGWRTGYTRKVFHFLVFTTAAATQAAFGFRALAVFGGMTSLLIFYALLRGDGNLFYEAMARERDAPHRSWFIIAPYLATLAGGVLANAFFGRAAMFGTLVAGLGDAIGEPVGTRYGRHRYRAPSLRGVPAERSWEGSAAVFAMSLAAMVIASVVVVGSVGAWTPLVAIALAAAAAEAVSPHGWDNLTLQIVPAALATLLLPV